MKKLIIPAVACSLAVAVLALWHVKAHEIHSRDVFLTDVFIEIRAVGREAEASQAMDRAVAELVRIESRLGYRNSLVDELNRKGTVQDPELFALVRTSRQIHEASSGAFSITLRPILDAWGFTGLHPFRLPTGSELKAWRQAPRDDAVRLLDDGATIVIPEGAAVDIGGIIEGHAADRACETMKLCGVRTGLVNVGGEVRAFGNKSWQVGVRNPRGQGLLAVFPLKDRAVATSGDYERFFVHEGRSYCHTLDPATGHPPGILMSASVVAKNCTLANAWAVALFVQGQEKLGPVIERMGMEWVVVDRKGRTHASAALRRHLKGRS